MSQSSGFFQKLVVLELLGLVLGGCSAGGGTTSGGSSAGATSTSAAGASGGVASSVGSSGGGSSGGFSRTVNGGSSGAAGSSASDGGRTGGSGGVGAGGTGGSAGAGGTASSGAGGGTGGSSVVGTTSSAGGGGGTVGSASGEGGTGGSASGGATGGSSAVSCPSPALVPGDSTHTIKSGGRDRSYVLHIPSGYKGNTAVPLLVDFHPHGSTGPDWRNGSPFLKLVDADGVISAFPSAIGDWNVGPCCSDGVDDVGFAKDLIKEVKSLACIDPKRVYAAGFSMGGGMTNYVACHAADVFAAFAPASFALLQEILSDCKPGRPITVAAFQGTKDPLVPYDGGVSNLVRPITFLSAVNTMKKWAELDGCTGAAADIGNGCQGYAAAQCQGEEVILCTKQGGGHEAADATLIWPLIKRHTLP